MSAFVKAELERLRSDYASTVGKPFAHFYCPVLFRDEETRLCRAHIINQAFPGSVRECTVQRADVDSFYGSRFEADFLDIRSRGKSPTEILQDSSLSKRFNARIYLDDNPVEHFALSKSGPGEFTSVQIGDAPGRPFGLKMHPIEALAAEGGRWEVEVSRDLRVPMLVTAIKAAHLSLFKLLGYRYALTATGWFIGREILGEFFLRNRGLPKREVPARAHEFFRRYVHMVRPVVSNTEDLRGTVSDRVLLMCAGTSGLPWASVVFVRTGDLVHAVMVPNLAHPDQVSTSLGFLDNGHSSIRVAAARFEGDRWDVERESRPMSWPKDGVLYPS